MNCPNCGLEIQGDATYCPNCGTPIAPVSAEPQPNPASGLAPQPIHEDTTPNSMEKTLAIEAYLGLLVLAPLFGAKESKFVRFHVNQGIILCALSLVLSAIIALNFIIMFAADETALYIILGLFSGLFGLVACAVIALAVFGIINVLKGKMKPLPVIGKIKILK